MFSLLWFLASPHSFVCIEALYKRILTQAEMICAICILYSVFKCQVLKVINSSPRLVAHNPMCCWWVAVTGGW